MFFVCQTIFLNIIVRMLIIVSVCIEIFRRLHPGLNLSRNLCKFHITYQNNIIATRKIYQQVYLNSCIKCNRKQNKGRRVASHVNQYDSSMQNHRTVIVFSYSFMNHYYKI